MITYQTIDLGLPSGTLWCDRNIGASSPEDAGLYFAWGEIKGYTAEQIGKEKQFNNDNYTYKDNPYTLPLDKDAAHINIGKDWSMPTREDFQELFEYTTNEWVSDYNGTGLSGRVFTSKINGNSIFVPAVGYASGGSVYVVGGEGSLWSSSLYEDSTGIAWNPFFNSGSAIADGYYGRCYGFPVRGIRNPDFSHLFFNNKIMAKIYFYNEDCLASMKRMQEKNFKVDIVLSSPPYNSGRPSNSKRSIENYESRYDIHLDNMTDEEYSAWICEIFNNFDKILNKNGVILWNISYGNEKPNSMWLSLLSILQNTNFMIAEMITWKKKSALPNNVSHNKLTRIIEPVFVLCRKDEFKTYNANKQVKSTSSTGQKYYENIYNFIEAPNNDGSCNLNKATYSSDLCVKLLNIYAKENAVVYDPFMGTGTTALACEKYGKENMICIGSELSAAQVEYSKNRLKDYREGLIFGTIYSV